jgi:hypothetical protein
VTRPSLDQLIDEAAKLPPGPDAWSPIFRAYPELSIEDLAVKFRESSERALHEAAELQRFADTSK